MTAAEADITQKAASVPPGTFRHTVLVAAKRFKSTWAELGKLLVQVRDESLWESWGYATFEAYCLKEEAERRPDFSAKVPIEFTIGNDGKVAQLWVDHPQLKKGALYDCFFTELRKWPFKSYAGERATVGLSFTVGKKG